MMIDVYLGLKITATFPLVIWDRLLVVMVDVDIGPRPATLPPITQVTMAYCCVYLVLLAMWMILFIKMKVVIVVVMVQDVEVGLNISATLLFTMGIDCWWLW